MRTEDNAPARASRGGDKGRKPSAPTDKTDTPLMRQYLGAKALNPDALLFFRCGDFYELFLEDAVTASKALDITLTSRNKGSPDEIPMAGVPYHAVSGYIQKLLDKNFKVAICEQMADPSTVKGIVPREVVRVATPAIPFDDSAVDGRKNLYLACIDRVGRDWGVSVFDASTGELRVSSASDRDAAVDVVLRYSPREIVVGPDTEVRATLESLLPGVLVDEPREQEAGNEKKELLAPSPSLWGSRGTTPAIERATARLFAYVRAADPKAPEPFIAERENQMRATLELDQTTREHLELVSSPAGADGTLLSLVDETCTHPGARLFRHWLTAPLCDVAAITERHAAVAFLLDRPALRDDLRSILGDVSDLERLATKIASGRVAPRELGRVRRTLDELPRIRACLAADRNVPALLGHEGTLDLDDVHAELSKALVDELPLRLNDGDVLREDYDQELGELSRMAKDGQSFMEATERELQTQTGISTLKVRYTRVFGWYLEVTKSHLDKVPSDWRRKQTIASGERYTSARLDELESRLTLAEERKKRRQEILFGELIVSIAGHVSRLRAASQTLARLDVLQGLAYVAHKRGYVRPEIVAESVLDIRGGRHPVVEARVLAGSFVANDVRLDAFDLTQKNEVGRLLLVTGPNMSGKSTYMRQVAILTILAQMGSFVPATSARIGLVDRILTRVGASDNLARGESTFMVEMKETARILRDATPRSLVVLDEIGRGTSTYDGLSIAWAVAEYIHNTSVCRALFATHYHELTQVTVACPHARNVSVSAREHNGKIVFLHAVEDGPASRSYGVACARLAGLPEGVLRRAEHLLAELEARRDAQQQSESASQLALFADNAPVQERAEAIAGARLEKAAREDDAKVNDLVASVDPDSMSPRDALAWIYRLKATARGEGS